MANHQIPSPAPRRMRWRGAVLRYNAARWQWTRSRRARRLLVAALAASLGIPAVLPWLLSRFSDSTSGAVTGLALLLLFLLAGPLWLALQLALWFLLDQGTRGVLLLAEADLDERQRGARDRAYRRSYRVIQSAAAVIVVAALLGRLPTSDRSWFLWAALVWSTLLLPSAVAAWTEPAEPTEPADVTLAGT